MNVSSPHLHQWLDAIQRGLGSSEAVPQLSPDVPVPSPDDQRALQTLHRDLTGDTLSPEWLTHVLQPMPVGAVIVPDDRVPEEVLPERGWKHWCVLFRRQRERPVHQFRTDQDARQSFLRWRRGTRATLWPGVALLGGSGWWLLDKLAPQLVQLESQWRAGVKAAGSEAAFQTQPLAHQLSLSIEHLGHQFTWCAYLMMAGLALVTVGNVLGAFQKKRKVALISVADRLAWAQSPRAQRYLQQRFEGQPFLVGDQMRLKNLVLSDRVLYQMVPAPLADRKTPSA